jgi:hypothetical protein
MAYPNPARRRPVSFAYKLTEPADVELHHHRRFGTRGRFVHTSGTLADNLEIWDPGSVPAAFTWPRLRFRAPAPRTARRSRWGCCDEAPVRPAMAAVVTLPSRSLPRAPARNPVSPPRRDSRFPQPRGHRVWASASSVRVRPWMTTGPAHHRARLGPLGRSVYVQVDYRLEVGAPRRSESMTLPARDNSTSATKTGWLYLAVEAGAWGGCGTTITIRSSSAISGHAGGLAPMWRAAAGRTIAGPRTTQADPSSIARSMPAIARPTTIASLTILLCRGMVNPTTHADFTSLRAKSDDQLGTSRYFAAGCGSIIWCRRWPPCARRTCTHGAAPQLG